MHNRGDDGIRRDEARAHRADEDRLDPIAERCADGVLWDDWCGASDFAGAPFRRECAALEHAGAATAAVLVARDPEPCPPEIRGRFEQVAVRFLMEEHGLRLADIGTALDAVPGQPRVREPRLAGRDIDRAGDVAGGVREGGGRVIDTTWISNLVAAAALIAAFALYWTRPAGAAPVEAQYQQLLNSPSLVRFDWADGPSSLGGDASGHVVWDPTAQRGFMVFDRLAPNPDGLQYQLWIFDASRGRNIPVDGGLFDISDAAQRHIVPITAKVPVREAFAFAVTAEPPGGVVVSKREEIISLAGEVGQIGPPKLN